jgi:hypothetical protein
MTFVSGEVLVIARAASSRQLRHAQIQDRDVGLCLRGEPDRLAAIGSRGDDLEALGAQRDAKPSRTITWSSASRIRSACALSSGMVA